MSALASRVGRAADVLAVLCLVLVALLLIGWALGFVHFTGIHQTTIEPPIAPSLEA